MKKFNLKKRKIWYWQNFLTLDRIRYSLTHLNVRIVHSLVYGRIRRFHVHCSVRGGRGQWRDRSVASSGIDVRGPLRAHQIISQIQVLKFHSPRVVGNLNRISWLRSRVGQSLLGELCYIWIRDIDVIGRAVVRQRVQTGRWSRRQVWTAWAAVKEKVL